ncbi:MAG: hypothetical protein ACOYOU_10000 [Kiritimatiellia bacterium]
MTLVSHPANEPLPPHLTMDEYVDFVSESLRHVSTANLAQQKQIEERIVRPFRIPVERLTASLQTA